MVYVRWRTQPLLCIHGDGSHQNAAVPGSLEVQRWKPHGTLRKQTWGALRSIWEMLGVGFPKAIPWIFVELQLELQNIMF